MATSVVLDKVVKNYGTVPVITATNSRTNPGKFPVLVAPPAAASRILLG